MHIQINTNPLDQLTEELLVAGMFENELPNTTRYRELDELTHQGLSAAFERKDFTGKKEQSISFYNSSNKGPVRILIIGLGKRDEAGEETVRRSYGKAGHTARTWKSKDIALLLPPVDRDDNAESFSQATCEGFSLSMYRFKRYFTEDLDSMPDINSIVFVADDGFNRNSEQGVRQAEITIEGVSFARDLTNTPGQDLYPESYAEIAKELECETVFVEILDEKRLAELGMGALLGVGVGSDRPPRLIHLVYEPGIENAKTLALVGKGITFDAGGLDLKSAAGMRDMKVDMGGSAAVMGIFKSLPAWGAKCRVEGFIPAAENMPGSKAYRPGDVLKSYAGLTIEIDNTDAEGRLALADALAYAVDTAKPAAMIDFATLTGACVIALGEHATGMMANNDDLAELLSKSGNVTGERVWRLPLWEDYKKQIKSKIADLKNTGGRPAGSITAGKFLEAFVGDVPWVHLDIAGTVNEVTLSYVPGKEIATGVGVRLILDFLKKWAS